MPTVFIEFERQASTCLRARRLEPTGRHSSGTEKRPAWGSLGLRGRDSRPTEISYDSAPGWRVPCDLIPTQVLPISLATW